MYKCASVEHGPTGILRTCNRRGYCIVRFDMRILRLMYLFAVGSIVACSASTNDVEITLAPDVVSSLDGTLAVHAIVLGDREPMSGVSVDITVDYKDRKGVAHAIDPV